MVYWKLKLGFFSNRDVSGVDSGSFEAGRGAVFFFFFDLLRSSKQEEIVVFHRFFCRASGSHSHSKPSSCRSERTSQRASMKL